VYPTSLDVVAAFVTKVTAGSAVTQQNGVKVPDRPDSHLGAGYL
jgi:hypothetical protein